MAKTHNLLLFCAQRKNWEKIGFTKKAGIVVPLFSVWSKKCFGIGEFLDLKILVDWAEKVGFKIIQLLPLNDVGFDVSPYGLQSGFALNPLYLSLRRFLPKLRKKESGKTRVDYEIKKEKLKILRNVFLKKFNKNSEFEIFEAENKYWLEDYAVYRCLKKKFKQKRWEDWPRSLREKDKKIIFKIKKIYKKEIDFQKWLQWESFKELKEVKDYAQKRKVFIMGDFPWLVGRDSADVWGKREYFNLNFSVGAPPDEFSRRGQRWGMPPFFWNRVLKDNFVYFTERINYLQNFYHILRVDHIIGFFRTWQIPISDALRNKGKNGFFDLKEESLQQERGEMILRKMIRSSQSLICGEDLGSVPCCLPGVLKKLGIPGIKVLRWAKSNEGFLRPEQYPLLSIATLSTHDTSNFLTWFEKEANDKEREDIFHLFKLKKPYPKKVLFEALRFVHQTNSIFTINPLWEWLFLTDYFKKNPSFYRINCPGKALKRNWTLRLPISLEELRDSDLSEKIREITLSKRYIF